MWKWYSADGSGPATAAPGMQEETNTMSVMDIGEQLAQTEQLVVHLKELIREKDNQLQSKDQQLKEEKEASDAKLSKAKLQNKAKVASLSSQLEELKKQLAAPGSQQKKSDKKASGDGEQENAAANRGKILVLRRKVEELESRVSQKNEELQKKIAEVEAQRLRGSEMDAILVQKEKKLAEKEAYIIELQMAVGSSNLPKDVAAPGEDQKDSSLQDMQMLIQNLTRKVGDSEEKYSLLQEQTESLKALLSRERDHFQEREAMYVENIRMFQNIIQEKEKDLIVQAQNHEQELFKLAAKSDASADLEQLLKALKQKLHEKEEVLLGRNQVINILQKELDAKDQQLKEINERSKRLQSEKENLQSKLDAEKHVMRAQLRDMMDKHQAELKLVDGKHKAEVREIQEKHGTEIQEKDQVLLQLQKQVEQLGSSGQSSSGQAIPVDAASKQRIEKLEAQVKLKSEEVSKSEAKFFKLKSLSKSKIKQLEDELKSVQSASKHNEMSDLNERISDLENEKEQLQTKLEALSELKTQNEELHAKLELYEEQQRKLQADLEQVTKRAASQTSESGSADELQNQVLEWQEMIPGSEETLDQLREEKSAIALRMVQIEEEREGLIEDDWFFPGCSDPAIVSGQQDLEEELTSVQGMGRLPHARRKGNQAAKKPQGDYGYNSQRYEDPNITLDSVDSSEGENMGGLQTVVEELELERNQLQEQIMTLEERCQDLEDRLQLQVRIESLQNENERLQTQLMQLRSQFSREAEMHQALSSNLNEQLKGLSERKISLEISLVEKEQKLLETAGKLEQMTTLSQSFQEQDVLNKELSEKLVQSEQQLEETKNRCESYETECAELKVTNNDLIDKVNTLKEKTSKQDLALEIIHRDLDQTNEELDRLNTSHLEERSQLIHDLQRCERENDSLKETIEEKDKELASLSFSMTEYSEQLLALKQQMQYKEEEMREMEDNLVKAKRENNLLREAQSSDVQDSSIKMSALTEKLDEMELELNKTTGQNEAQANEAKELIRQINEYSETIKDLRSQIQTHIVAHRNHVMECEAQILLLKDQIRVSAEKLLETDTKQKQEIEHLHAKLEENCSSKEKLSNLLEEKEKKEQSFERELKSVKDQNNQLISKAAKKDEDLAKLSKQLEENIGHQETLKLLQQEKLEAIASLEENLQLAKQQSEDMKLKCVENERENRELKKQLKDSREMIAKLEVLKQELALNNKQLQVTLEEKDVFLSDQIRVVSDLTKSMNIVESKQQLLINENNNLLKQINDKESEVLKLGNAVMELEKKILKNEEQVLDDQNTILLLRHDKDDLIKKIEDLSVLCEQKDISISSELLEKTKECNFLSEQLSMNRESIQCLHKEMHDLGAQLKEAKEAALKKEAALQNALTQCTTLHEQLQQNQERIELFEKQIKELTADLELKSKALQDTSIHFEEKICMITGLKNEAQTMEAENKKLSQWVEERDCTLKQKNAELENLHQLNDKKVEENIAQNNQIEMLCKEIDKLKMDKEEVLVRFSNKLNECENLNTQATQNQSEVVSLKQLAHTLELENQKLKADLEIIHTTVTKKTEEIAILSSHLSQQGHTILALKDQIDNMNIEKQELQHNFYEKEAILAQRETLIQEIKEAKLTEDGRSLHTISDLQKQLQNVVLETTQLRKTIQDKENELIRQGQEIQLFKDKSEESHLFKVQLSENMEVISDLHVQIQNVNEKSEELNQLLFKKDESLKQKVGDYVNLKAKYSEMEDFSEMQQKQFEALMVEANQLKADILEKDRLFKNTSDYTDELKLKLQDKEIACESLRQQVKNLEVEIVLLKQEISNQKSELSDVKVSMAEKDNCLLEKENLIKNLKDKTSKQETYYSQLEEKLLIVSQLQSQVNSVTNELLSSKELANEKEKAFLNLQEKCADHSEQINQLNKTLGEKQVYISELLKSLNQKDISIQIAEGNAHVLTNELQLLRGEFEKKCAILKNNNSLFEEKDNIISVNQKTINSLTTDLEAAKMECRRNLDEINAQKCDMQQIELNVQSLRDKCLEQSQHIENLKSDIKHLNSVSSQDIYDKTLLIENLQLQMNYVVKEKNLLIDDIKRMTQENENVLATYQKQLLHQSEELKELHAKMEHSLKDSEVEINTVTLQMKNEKEQLQKQGQDLSSLSNAEMVQLKSRVDDLERALQKAKDFQERTENEVSLYQAELAELRTEKSLLVTEARALRDQCHRTIAEKDRQISELQTFHQEMISKESTSIKNIYAMKALETSSLVGNANIPDQVKQLMAEKNQLQHEMQRCLQEMHQRERRFQQINAKDDMRAEVPPGAPQERASVIVEIDNMELSDLRKRLVEIEQHYDSSQQEVSQLAEKLEEEKTRRKAAEEALVLAEQHKRLGASNFISVPREYEYAVQMESDDEREALIIDPREHIVARKMKGGALSVRRWLRGRSIYCSKLLTSRAKSRYLFFTYLVTLHIVVVLCLAGVI